MSDTQQTSVIIAVLGWLYLYYLHTRTLRRTEISRIKDRLVARIEEIQTWYLQQLSSDCDDVTLLESLLATKVTHVELRILQINHYVGRDLIPIEWLTPLRALEVLPNNRESVSAINQICADLIEGIETSYDSLFFRKNFFARFWNTRKEEILGTISGLLLLYLLFEVLSQIIP